MKRLIKLPLRILWRATGPLRRPVVRRFESWFDRYLTLSARTLTEEANLVLDFTAAELARLQIQVEAMRGAVDELEPEGLAVVGSEG